MMAGCPSQHPTGGGTPSTAQRLSFDERARVEAMSAAGVSVAGTARRLGRHRSTIHRELRRGRRDGAYDAEAAQAAAAVGAARPKTRVLAADPELAASVCWQLQEALRVSGWGEGVDEGPVGFAGVEQGSDPVVVEVGEPEGGAFDAFGQIDCWRPRSRRW